LNPSLSDSDGDGFNFHLDPLEKVIFVVAAPLGCVLESREEYAARRRKCCEEVNRECDVEGLCRAFMGRITKLLDRKAGRLAE
jgi:hypothetical protein